MAKKENNTRLEYKLNDFFVEKLSFENNILKFGSDTRINDIASLINLDAKKAKKILNLKADNAILDDDQVAELAMEKGIEFEKVDDVSAENVVSKIIKLISDKEWPEIANVTSRPPVITIMGHVDHGKTTLLDIIRKSTLTKSEAGGITQTIGAYQVEINGKQITFIDTPGHEAFTEMRANGSQVTDIVIIIVAADDSIMNQTKESIDHAKAANVPIIVAVNKMDAPGANIDKVKQDLTDYGLVPEEWGGDVPFVEISALKNEGIDTLLETINLQTDLLELTSPENILAAGTVIESNVDKKRGNLVSIIVNHGTLKTGDDILIDDFVVRIKAMHDDMGQIIKEAKPGKPVELYGVGQSPLVGSKFVVYTDKWTPKIADTIKEAKVNALREKKTASIDDLFANFSNDKKAFNIILKADGLGVLSAIEGKLIGLSNDEIEVNVIRKDIGEITNTDISLAEASNASIYTFNVKLNNQLEAVIKSKGIRVFPFDIIYELFEDIEMKISGMSEDKFEEVKTGEAQVLQLFSFSKIGTIAGCSVKTGTIGRGSIIKVYRGKDLIFEGKISTLKIEKNEVKEVRAGQECGITITDFNDMQEGDIIEAYEQRKIT